MWQRHHHALCGSGMIPLADRQGCRGGQEIAPSSLQRVPTPSWEGERAEPRITPATEHDPGSLALPQCRSPRSRPRSDLDAAKPSAASKRTRAIAIPDALRTQPRLRLAHGARLHAYRRRCYRRECVRSVQGGGPNCAVLPKRLMKRERVRHRTEGLAFSAGG